MLKSLVGLAVLCGASAQFYNAHAQDIELYNPVRQFEPDDWSKPPRKFGPFLLSSEITLMGLYNDNIFARNTDEEADFTAIVRPKLELAKGFERHRVALTFSGDARKYKDNTDEDQFNFITTLAANLEAYHNLELPLAIFHSQEHINRTDSSQIGAFTREPVKVLNTGASAGLIYEPNRFKLEFLGSYTQKRIPDGDTVLPGAGITTISTDRDKDTTKFETIFSYDTRRNWKPQLKLEYVNDNYVRRLLTATGFDGTDQDNESYRALVGLSYDHKDLISASILVGQQRREYKDPTVDSISGASAEAALTFTPTEKTAAKFKFSRINNDDNILLTGVRQNIYEGLLTHEFTSRLDGQLELEYRQTDYLNLNREDQDFNVVPSLIYKIKRGLFLEGSYRFNTRDSDDANAVFDQNIFSVGLRSEF